MRVYARVSDCNDFYDNVSRDVELQVNKVDKAHIIKCKIAEIWSINLINKNAFKYCIASFSFVINNDQLF